MLEALKKFFNWLDTKTADRVFAVLFAVFAVLDLSKGYYWSALFDVALMLLSIWSLKRKLAKGKS